MFDGLRGCDALAVSPDQAELAVACTGDDLADKVANNDHSGGGAGRRLGDTRERRRFAASTWGEDSARFLGRLRGDGVLLVGTLGTSTSQARSARWTQCSASTPRAGVSEAVLRSEHTPFTLGAIRCLPACGVCFAADAERAGGSVQRFAVDSTAVLSAPSTIVAESRVGLPPRYLSVF